jgi:hypothetical protein
MTFDPEIMLDARREVSPRDIPRGVVALRVKEEAERERKAA